MSQIYIGNLAPEVDEQLLFELMLQMSPVLSVQMPKNKATRKHQGYGFATFTSESDADYVLKVLQDTQLRLYGRQIRINRAQRASQPAADQISQRLFVGNLDPDLVSEDSLALPFSRFGPVFKIEIARDPSGRPKGYAFVSMPSGPMAEEAVSRMNGQYLLNRVCKVEFERLY